MRFALLALASVAPLFSQAVLRLHVQDPSGAGIPLHSTVNGQSFDTDTTGRATVALPPGAYRLQLAKSGFQSRTLDFRITDAKPTELLVTLPLAQAPTSSVTVTAVTPLAGIDVLRDQLPSPIQTLSSHDLESAHPAGLADLLNQRLAAVSINEIQGNPFQPDVNYRGYTASPLLGSPQGISVYLDGVRLNQPFGDVVSWDLLPRLAIAEVTLVPGSNPLFGLNTLGGALALQTKDGASHPGTTLQLGGGSFGRKTAELEHGGSTLSGLHWYAATELFFEDGWRDSSPSNVRQFFGKIGRRRANHSLTLSGGYANNHLNGNGLQEFRLLAADYRSVYTRPDVSTNRAPYLTLTARHNPTNTWNLTANAYFRSIRGNSFNGDINSDSLNQSVYQPSAADRTALTRAGYTGFPVSGATAANTPFPFWRCIAQVLQNDEPGEKCTGLLTRSTAAQINYGLTGQATWSPTGRRARLTAGAAWDRSRSDFVQSTELGYLNPDRTVTGLNAFADGRTGGNVDGVPFDNRANLRGNTQTGSVYASQTLEVKQRWNLVLSGRYNRTLLDNHDRLDPVAGPGSLTGNHTFGRFNPAAGLTVKMAPTVTGYFSYSEGSRAPTGVELGCADPASPCKLPNALAGDPPLRQVVTRTLEGGLRGQAEGMLHWSAGWFRASNLDDILFVSSPQTGYGYFKNFGRTLRQGLETSASTQWRTLTLRGNYTLLQATYESAETVNGTGSSASGARGLEGTIAIAPGAYIPLIPQHIGKAQVALQVTKKSDLTYELTAFSSAYARGNENNQHQPDGRVYLGPGTSDAYTVSSLGAVYRFHPRLQTYVRVNNLFDAKYSSGAQLGPTGFTASGNYIARSLPAIGADFPVTQSTFQAPGAPRGIQVGLRVHF